MLPEQVIQAHRDLRGEWLLPIHNATFDLAFHAWDEPLEKILSLGAQNDIRLTMPRIGEPVLLGQQQPAQPWWRERAAERSSERQMSQASAGRPLGWRTVCSRS
jgi:hypothetical protein